MKNKYIKRPCYSCGGKKGFWVVERPPMTSVFKDGQSLTTVWVACGFCKGYGYRLEKEEENTHEFLELDLNTNKRCPFSEWNMDCDSENKGCNLVGLDLANVEAEYSEDCYGNVDNLYIDECSGYLNSSPFWCPLVNGSAYTFNFKKGDNDKKI